MNHCMALPLLELNRDLDVNILYIKKKMKGHQVLWHIASFDLF